MFGFAFLGLVSGRPGGLIRRLVPKFGRTPADRRWGFPPSAVGFAMLAVATTWARRGRSGAILVGRAGPGAREPLGDRAALEGDAPSEQGAVFGVSTSARDPRPMVNHFAGNVLLRPGRLAGARSGRRSAVATVALGLAGLTLGPARCGSERSDLDAGPVLPAGRVGPALGCMGFLGMRTAHPAARRPRPAPAQNPGSESQEPAEPLERGGRIATIPRPELRGGHHICMQTDDPSLRAVPITRRPSLFAVIHSS